MDNLGVSDFVQGELVTPEQTTLDLSPEVQAILDKKNGGHDNGDEKKIS